MSDREEKHTVETVDQELSDYSSNGSPSVTGEDLKPTKITKQKRKRILKDVNAPKAPLTGYVRYLNEHREKFRIENPDMPFHEVTKILGQKWSSLDQSEKQQYLYEAEKDKEKYMKALQGYQQSSAYKEFQKKKRQEADFLNDTGKVKCDVENSCSPLKQSAEQLIRGPRITSTEDVHIPIFTEQFMDYSTKRESELRQLRKDNSVLEEQNALLIKQIEHMKNVVEQVKKEIIQQENENISMQKYLDQFKKTLVSSFEQVVLPSSLPGEPQKWSCSNVETKLAVLSEYLTSSDSEPVLEMQQKVKDIINVLKY
ncbi:high mobility group protein 20A [Hydra vulgaris]|uniref:High mobility group protein 20A n=1 Tax=Hydra vulgaris TaxID=6087 RepID=A0ABM4C2J6_HYDVU